MDVEVDGILVAAHELKTPLAVLRQLALSLPGMDFSGEHIRSEMVSVSERALRQVNDLTKMRCLDDGLFKMEPVAVRAVCDDVTNELEQLFSYHERGLLVRYSNRARLVTANRDLLHSVIYNFLINGLVRVASFILVLLSVGSYSTAEMYPTSRRFSFLSIGLLFMMSSGRWSIPIGILPSLAILLSARLNTF